MEASIAVEAAILPPTQCPQQQRRKRERDASVAPTALIEALPNEQTGWLAGLRDRFVGRALALMHQAPGHPWTVDDLAKQVGLSRSALADRFVELLGQPPMHYLTHWRLSLAAQQLLSTKRGLAQIALDVGYDSEAAFNRAFKRAFDVPPATWRKNKGNLAQNAKAAATSRQ